MKIINFDDVTGENIKEYAADWPPIPDHLYGILIIRGFGSGQANVLLNLKNYQHDIYKSFLYVKDLCEAKYKLLIKKCEKVCSKQCNDSKVYIEYLNDMDDMKKMMNTIRIKNAEY